MVVSNMFVQMLDNMRIHEAFLFVKNPLEHSIPLREIEYYRVTGSTNLLFKNDLSD